MCVPAAAAAVAAAVIGAGATVYSSEKASKSAKKARKQAEATALKAEEQADQEFNALNKKRPGTQRLIDGNTSAAKAGGASTLLTGTQGVNATDLSLSTNTLLGG